MKIYKTLLFKKWADKEGLKDNQLVDATHEMNNGLINAKLGANIYKKRIATFGKGKRGGSRTIVAFKSDEKAFFIYGFMKNEQDNIDKKQFQSLKRLADEYFAYSSNKLTQLIDKNELFEVKNEK